MLTEDAFNALPKEKQDELIEKARRARDHKAQAARNAKRHKAKIEKLSRKKNRGK